METEQWNIGSEFDYDLLEDVRRLLISLGYKEDGHWSGMGGSQEISHWEYMVRNGRLVLETETYIGLTLEGPRILVMEVQSAFENLQR